MSAFTFIPILAFFTYGISILLVILVVYALFLAIKALRIYIQKNS